MTGWLVFATTKPGRKWSPSHLSLCTKCRRTWASRTGPPSRWAISPPTYCCLTLPICARDNLYSLIPWEGAWFVVYLKPYECLTNFWENVCLGVFFLVFVLLFGVCCLVMLFFFKVALSNLLRIKSKVFSVLLGVELNSENLAENFMFLCWYQNIQARWNENTNAYLERVNQIEYRSYMEH